MCVCVRGGTGVAGAIRKHTWPTRTRSSLTSVSVFRHFLISIRPRVVGNVIMAIEEPAEPSDVSCWPAVGRFGVIVVIINNFNCPTLDT